MNAFQIKSSKVSKESHNQPRFFIEEVSTEAELREVARFRYEIYAEEMENKSKSSDPETRTISDDLDSSGIILVARIDGEIVATGRLNIVDRKMAKCFPELQLHRLIDQFGAPVAVATKFAVRKDYRGTRIFSMIAERLFLRGVRLGVRAYVLHSMKHLIELYRRMGFREYLGKVIVDGVTFRDGKPIEFEPMYLPCEARLLRELRSPFYRLVRKREGMKQEDCSKILRATGVSSSFQVNEVKPLFRTLLRGRYRQKYCASEGF